MYRTLQNILNNSTMINWTPIVISALSLAFGIFNSFSTKKNAKIIRKEQRYFDRYKDQKHHKEKEFELKLQQIDSRSQIIPYFVLSLDDDGLKVLNHRKIIELSLINIGKESAINIRLSPWDEIICPSIYFVTTSVDQHNHHIYKYLDKTFAMPQNKISLAICVDDQAESVSNRVQFKIQYSDLIGRTYEQEFSFRYSYKGFINGFHLERYSKTPKLIEDVKK